MTKPVFASDFGITASAKWVKFLACLLALFCVALPNKTYSQQLIVEPTTLTVNANMWENPASEPIKILVTNAASAQWHWHLVTNSWLMVNPTNGSGVNASKTATVQFVTANLDAGTYNSDITVVSPLTTNVSERISVTLNVGANPGVAQGVRVAPGTYGEYNNFIVPIELISTGDVNGVSFTLTFNKNVFSASGVALGSGIPPSGGTLITNTTQVRTYGRMGIAITLGPGLAFPAGTVEVATVSLTANSKTAAPGAYPVGFMDIPIARGLADVNANYISGAWPTGNVMLVAGIEGDVAPRASNDLAVTTIDVTQIGRFAAGLDKATAPSEFQKADIAPVSTFGDAAISVIDWVQAALYAASMTPPNVAGGPYAPLADTLPLNAVRAAGDRSASVLRAGSFAADRGDPCTLPLELKSMGNENAIGFSLEFDPALLQFKGVRPLGVPSGASFLVNNLEAEEGRLGVLMALSPGTTMPATNRVLLEVDFMATSGADPARTSVRFSDSPVRREVANVLARAVPIAFEDAGEITLLPGQWDAAPPAAVFSTTASDPARVAPVPVTVTFTKKVQGFEPQRIVPGNARIANFAGSGRVYTFDLFPINRGRITASIPAGAVKDLLGTASEAEAVFSHRFGSAPGDMDGDGRADLLVYDPLSGCWYVRGAAGVAMLWGQAWGGSGLTPVLGDYDGDGMVDMVVYQESTGLWFARNMNGATLFWAKAWGGPGFMPVAGDYDGDLIADLSVYAPASAAWFIRSLATGSVIAWNHAWGGAGFVPVAGDYNGDLVSDLALFAPDAGQWFALSLDGSLLLWAEAWGGPGMVAVSGDFDGDGRADLALYQESAGLWYIKSSAAEGAVLAWATAWGGPGFAPVAGDFDGDGRADLAVYNRASGMWYAQTLDGSLIFWDEAWGGMGLVPCSE